MFVFLIWKCWLHFDLKGKATLEEYSAQIDAKNLSPNWDKLVPIRPNNTPISLNWKELNLPGRALKKNNGNFYRHWLYLRIPIYRRLYWELLLSDKVCPNKPFSINCFGSLAGQCWTSSLTVELYRKSKKILVSKTPIEAFVLIVRRTCIKVL